MTYKIKLIAKNGFNGLIGKVTAKNEDEARKLISETFEDYTIDKIEEDK